MIWNRAPIRSTNTRGKPFIAAAVAVSLAVLLLTRAAASDKWPQFRGPNAGVADDDPALPDTWSETENVFVEDGIPGLGWSSPVVWDDHVFLTSAVSAGKEAAPVKGLYDPGDDHGKTKAAADHRWAVYDVDFNTGKIRWTRELQIGTPPLLRHIKNSFASETAVTDGERVYVYFGSIGLLRRSTSTGSRVEAGARRVQRPQEFGTGCFASPPRGSCLHRQRQHEESFIGAFDANGP